MNKEAQDSTPHERRRKRPAAIRFLRRLGPGLTTGAADDDPTGIVSIVLEVFLSYRRYAAVLKWTTLSLFTYVAVVAVVHVPWSHALTSLVVPRVHLNAAYATAFVAILGTTISPYLFFWQAGQEVE